MSVEHWFDSLSRTRTRRTALKAAAGAGAALLLPSIRVPSASATPEEPCFKTCNDAAGIALDSIKNGFGSDGCKHFVPVAGVAALSGNVGLGGVLLLLGAARFAGCLDSAGCPGTGRCSRAAARSAATQRSIPAGEGWLSPQRTATPTQEIRCGDELLRHRRQVLSVPGRRCVHLLQCGLAVRTNSGSRGVLCWSLGWDSICLAGCHRCRDTHRLAAARGDAAREPSPTSADQRIFRRRALPATSQPHRA